MNARSLPGVFKHPVAQNAIGLYAVQFANLLLPIVLVPHLARVLRPEGWGAIVFAQSFAIWLQLVIDFGFNYSASREVARMRGDATHMQQIVAGVLGAKLLLMGVAFLTALAASIWVAVFRQHPDYVWWALLIAVTSSQYPIWYFQGIERMRGVALMNVGFRLAGAVVTIWLVQGVETAWLVLALQAAAALLAATVATTWLYREVRFQRPTLRLARTALMMGRTMFVASLTTSLYNSANSFILGLFQPTRVVGFYGGAERIHRLAISPFGPISQAFYPHMVRAVQSSMDVARRTAQRMLLLMFMLGLLISATLMIGAPLLVRIVLGPGYEASILLLRMFALQVPLTSVSRVLGIQWLVPRGKDVLFNTVVIAGAVTNIVTALLLVPRFGAPAMVATFLLSELVVTVSMMVIVQRQDKLLWPWAR